MLVVAMAMSYISRFIEKNSMKNKTKKCLDPDSNQGPFKWQKDTIPLSHGDIYINSSKLQYYKMIN